MNTVSEVGKVIEVKGSSIFDIQIISTNKRIRAKPKGSLCDQRKHTKKENELKPNMLVRVERLDYRVSKGGNYEYIIVSKLTNDEVRLILNKNKEIATYDDDMFSDSDEEIVIDEQDIDNI